MGSEVHAAQRTRQRWEIVGIWLITRVIVLGAAAVGSWTAISAHGGLRAYVGIWRQWDTAWYESIATYGYVGPYVSAFQDFHYNVAFFPGLPALMKVGMGLGLSATGTGLIVSLVASLIAGFGISRLTQEVGGTGPYGAMAFFVAPTALFVTAPYTEALFCALAVWAWIFARRQDWVWAGLLAGGAAVVRPKACSWQSRWSSCSRSPGRECGAVPGPCSSHSSLSWGTRPISGRSPAIGWHGRTPSETSGIGTLLIR